MSKTKRLQIIDGESLMSLPLTPLNFVVDTLQMICNTNYDNTCANDCRDLSALKRIADAPGIAILLIHHLRKEIAGDVFHHISGTAATSAARWIPASP